MFLNFIYIYIIPVTILMFKYNFHNLNYNFILKNIYLNKTNNFKNSYLKLQIQILIFRFK